MDENTKRLMMGKPIRRPSSTRKKLSRAEEKAVSQSTL